MTLQQAKARIGSYVVYTGGYPVIENGYITYVNKLYVFVCFQNDIPEYSKACNPLDLKLKSNWDKMSRWRDIINE